MANDQVHAYTWYFFLHTGAVYPGFDEITVTPPAIFASRGYQSLILYPGDALTVYALTTGTYTPQIPISYVDVTPI